MAARGPARFQKRKREIEKKRKRETKLERRAARRAEKAQQPNPDVEGQDPDLIGIEPGPQPPRED